MIASKEVKWLPNCSHSADLITSMKSRTGQRPSSNAPFGNKHSALVNVKPRRKPSTREGICNNVEDDHNSSVSSSQPQRLPAGGGDLLLQLRQLQQQQHLAAFTAGLTIPPIVQGTYPSTTYAGLPSAGLHSNMATSRPLVIEKSGQALEQLGSVLEQMKQESEGSAVAWREKLAEIALLTDQLAQTQEQLNVAMSNERARSDELEHAQEALKTLEAQATQNLVRHREELILLNDKAHQQEQSVKEMREKHEADLDKVQTQMHDTCIHYKEEKQVQLDEFRRKLDESQQIYDAKTEELGMKHATELQKLMQQASEHEQAKQELGQHLWNATKELEATSKREQKLHIQAQETQQNILRLQELAQSLEKELKVQGEVSENLTKQVKEATTRTNEEQAQNNELQARMGAEVSRFQAQLEQMEQEHAAALIECEKQAEEGRAKALKMQENTDIIVHDAQDELRHLRVEVQSLKAEKACLETQKSAEIDAVRDLRNQLQDRVNLLEETQGQVLQLQRRCETATNVTKQCLTLIEQTPISNLALAYQDHMSDDPLTQLPSVFQALVQLQEVSGGLEPLQLQILHLQQDLDNEREKFSLRERELQLRVEDTVQELKGARQDAQTFAEELAKLSQVATDREAQQTLLNEQLRQQIQELVRLQSESALQRLQVQKELESQRGRSASLESDKRALLAEIEHLHLSLEAQYRAMKDKQVELDQVRGLYRDLELRFGDLEEIHLDLEKSARQTSEHLAIQLQQAQFNNHEKVKELDKLQKEVESMTQSLSVERDEVARAREVEQTQRLHSEDELAKALEEKTQRNDDLVGMVTLLQTKVEQLKQEHAQDTERFRHRCDSFAQQLSDAHEAQLCAEKTVAATMQMHQDAQTNAQIEMEQLRTTFIPQVAELKTQNEAQVAELQQVASELDRVARGKQSLQLELQRATDDTQDALRALEIARRDARVQAQQLNDELESIRRELDAAHVEKQAHATLSDELQNKLTVVQNAATATIDELVVELQNAQDALNLERLRAKKEHDGGATRAHILDLEEQIRMRDAQARTNREEATRAQDKLDERVSELEVRLQRTANSLESKKQDQEVKAREVELVTRRAQEAERKLVSLGAASDTLQAKTVELKQTLESKIREAQEWEEKTRDEVLRTARERRAFEVQMTNLRDENQVLQQQLARVQRQEETGKQALERAQSDLARVATELRATTQRLENGHQTANQTIADITCRMQQSERTAVRLQQELDLERERLREAEVHRAELQRSLRHQEQLPKVVLDEDNETQAETTNTSLNEADQMSTSCEFHKFYANETLTPAELSKLPMAIIKAQLGLEFNQSNHHAPVKFSKSAVRSKSHKLYHVKEDDAIPLLQLEKLPMSLKDGHDSALKSPSNVVPSDNRSSSPQLLSPTSSRSSHNSKMSLDRNNDAASAIRTNSSLFTRKNGPIKKKGPKLLRSRELPSKSYSTISSSIISPKHHKPKARDKILPRISSHTA